MSPDNATPVLKGSPAGGCQADLLAQRAAERAAPNFPSGMRLLGSRRRRTPHERLDPALPGHSSHSSRPCAAGMATHKRVLVVGGGFAGLAAARELSAAQQFDVTIVDPKE